MPDRGPATSLARDDLYRVQAEALTALLAEILPRIASTPASSPAPA